MLILIPVAIHDFLCVHSFNNGRINCLLTTLLLYRSGYHVGKYISVERKIAKNKDLYYAAIEASQAGRPLRPCGCQVFLTGEYQFNFAIVTAWRRPSISAN